MIFQVIGDTLYLNLDFFPSWSQYGYFSIPKYQTFKRIILSTGKVNKFKDVDLIRVYINGMIVFCADPITIRRMNRFMLIDYPRNSVVIGLDVCMKNIQEISLEVKKK